MVHHFAFWAGNIDIGDVFEQASYVRCRRSSFCDIRGEREELACSLSWKSDRHETHKYLNNGIFTSDQEFTSVPEKQGLQSGKVSRGIQTLINSGADWLNANI